MTSSAKMVKEASEVYHAHPAVSASKLRSILRSPLHYKSEWIDGNRSKDTPAKAFGTLAHTAILEPRLFLDNYVIEPKFEGKGSRNAKKEWLEGLPDGAIVMDEEEAAQLVGMIKAVQEHPVAADLLRRGIAEHSGYYTDPKTGLPCKFRPDYLTEDGWIIDIKSTIHAGREPFSRQIGTLGYFVSPAHYLTGYRTVMGSEPRGFIYIAVEKYLPHAVGVYVADNTIVEMGDIKRRKALDTLKQCIDANEWPGYQTEAENISLPHWLLYDEDQEGSHG